MSEFTSGEWRFNKERFAIETDEKEICVIDLWATHLNTKEEERFANAYLLAAAPELYESLKHMLYIFDRDLPESSIGRRTCDAAKRAIEKAEKEG